MGADNLLEFHRWRHWQEIIRLMPVAIIDRPGATWNVTAAKVVKYFARSRISEAQAPMLAEMIPPAFVVIHGPRSGSSSTLSRAQAQHGKFWSQQE
jgi:nicotinate-nucleotide adenylyltransferase